MSEQPNTVRLWIQISEAEGGEILAEMDMPSGGTQDEIAEMLAHARFIVRKMVGDIETQLNCGGMFSLQVARHFSRLLRETPLAEKTLIQERPTDE